MLIMHWCYRVELRHLTDKLQIVDVQHADTLSCDVQNCIMHCVIETDMHCAL